ncbi:MAG: Si-specific NAD(P)(+) transhydrogenase [Phycisphaerales bacterium]
MSTSAPNGAPSGFDYDLVCIGSGPAGEKAATQAAYFKRRVAIIEKSPHPGGAMVNTGTLPSKALRETALLFSSFRRRTVPGLEVNLAENVSVPKLMARMRAVQQIEHDRIERAMERHHIDVHRGHGFIMDEHTVRISGPAGEHEITTSNILIATGSKPARPKDLGYDHPHIVDSDGLLNLQRLPDSLLIVGGGVIGCEYACVFAELGLSVTLIEPRATILPFLDHDLREVLLGCMDDIGVRVLTGQVVSDLRGGGSSRDCVVASLEDGSVVEAEYALWAAGRSGATRGLGLENVGLRPNHRGYLEVDGNFRTSCPSVYAAGDVIGFPALASTSMEQGRVAACHMFGIDFKTQVSPITPIGLYTLPPASMVGLTLEDAKRAGIDAMAGKALLSHNARGRILNRDDTTHSGLIKIVFEYPTRRILGVQIVGDEATELIHVAATMLSLAEEFGQGATLDHLIHMVFNYPSLSEAYRYAAINGLQKIAVREGRQDELAGKAAVA